jgi:protease-4
VKLLRQARFDDHIKAVVLRIDSPGGSMLASEVIRREINALRAAGKPVVASMSSTAASGGYYIAMDTDEIWASPSTITGSIGVFGVFPTFEKTLGKIGVTVDGVGTTPLASALQPERTMSNEAKQILQVYIENAYNTFIGHVASARQKSVEEIDDEGQGPMRSSTVSWTTLDRFVMRSRLRPSAPNLVMTTRSSTSSLISAGVQR